MGLAPGTWHLASPLAPTWGWHGAEEPITRSPPNRLKANAELVRTAFFWKLLVEDLSQSGWLSNKKTFPGILVSLLLLKRLMTIFCLNL